MPADTEISDQQYQEVLGLFEGFISVFSRLKGAGFRKAQVDPVSEDCPKVV